jgi:hypothetical protein
VNCLTAGDDFYKSFPAVFFKEMIGWTITTNHFWCINITRQPAGKSTRTSIL